MESTSIRSKADVNLEEVLAELREVLCLSKPQLLSLCKFQHKTKISKIRREQMIAYLVERKFNPNTKDPTDIPSLGFSRTYGRMPDASWKER